jgi:glycosyltransferase involved in cell wall biosynthesis
VEFLINKPPVEIATEFPIKVLKSKGDIPRALEIGKYLKEHKVDICYASMRPQSNVLGLVRLFYPKLQTKLVGSIHNTNNFLSYNKWYHLPYRYLEKLLLERNNMIVAVSNAVKEDIKKAFFIKDEKIRVIYNPIDIEAIQKKAEEPIESDLEQLFNNHPVIINVARHEKQKGLHHLIKIFAKVNKKIPETRLVLIGDGSLRSKWEKLATDLGLKDKVLFLGWRENPFPYVKRAKLFALTSLWEGLPMVILETMALGVPPIAFKTSGGHVEVLENCCPLIEYPDEETYAGEIIKILTDEGYYNSLKQRVRERVKEFSADRIAEKYLKLIRET